MSRSSSQPDVARELSFEQTRGAWDELHSGARYFFQTLPWVELVAANVRSSVRWHVTARMGRPAFVAIFAQRWVSRGVIRLRILTSLRPVPGGPPLVDGLIDATAAEHLRFTDIARDFGPWNALVLRGLRIGSPWLKLHPDSARIVSEPSGGAAIFETACAFDERWRAVPKNMRGTVRKARNKIAEGARVEVARGEALEAAFDAFVVLEAAGWKGAAQTALAQRPGERELLRAFLLVSESAEVRSLYVAGRLAASQLCVQVGGTLFLMKVAYDEAFAGVSPSNVLFAALVETCCANTAVERIDCLVWASWHAHWGMTREPTYALTAFNRKSPTGRLALLAWGLREKLRDMRLAAG